MDLIAVALLTAVIAPLLALADVPDALRAPLGLPFLLFFPGYVLVAAIFPRQTWPGAVERLALSGVASLAVVPLIGIALNYSPWGLRAGSILAFVGLFIVLVSVLGIAHRRAVPADQRLDFGLGRLAARVFRSPRRLAYAVAVASLSLAAIAVTIIAVPQVGQRGTSEQFTEFYLLGADGTAEGYPTSLTVGTPATVTIGIANREGEVAVYTASLFVNGDPIAEYRSIRLGPGQRLERPVTFSLRRVGEGQVVRFVLRLDGQSEPYRSLHLRLDGWAPDQRPPAPIESEPFPVARPAAAVAPAEAAPENAPPPAPPPPNPTVHLVSPGEYLSLIARRYGLALLELLAANSIPDPNLIYPDQSINLPLPGGGPGSE